MQVTKAGKFGTVCGAIFSPKPAPGMALKVPATVAEGSEFTVTISGNPVPVKGSPGFAGFAAEVQVTPGLKYSGINDCLSEVKVTVQGGGPLQVCISFNPVGGTHAIVVVSSSQVFPSPELDASGPNEDLANFSYQCNRPGTQTITLLTAAQSIDGSAYADPNLSIIDVKPKVGSNADQIAVNCVGSVGGVAELSEVAGTPLETADSSSPSTTVLAGVAAAIAAGTVTLGGAAWYARRRA